MKTFEEWWILFGSENDFGDHIGRISAEEAWNACQRMNDEKVAVELSNSEAKLAGEIVTLGREIKKLKQEISDLIAERNGHLILINNLEAMLEQSRELVNKYKEGKNV